MIGDIPSGVIVSLLGCGLGIIFGATAQRTDFCTMGGLSDIYFMGDWSRFRAWMLAVAVAIAGSQLLHISELIDLSNSIYLTPNLGWAGAIVGGLLFGFGMTMGGGCGNKTLVRIGTGNLKSLVVALIMGIFAYMTLRGLIGLARVEFEALTIIDLATNEIETQSIPALLTLAGLPEATGQIAVSIIAVSGILLFCFKSARFRSSKVDIAAGLIIGLLIPAGWYVTGVIGYDDFDPVQIASFTFVAPVGESIQYLMTFTGATINFGISIVGGVILGSFISAKVAGEFQLESFINTEDMTRHMIGGAIMGIGGVLALGCTVGQGLSGVSTLAFGSVIALASIIAGGVFGLKYLEEGSLSAAFASLFEKEA